MAWGQIHVPPPSSLSTAVLSQRGKDYAQHWPIFSFERKARKKKFSGNFADFSPSLKKWTLLPFTGRRGCGLYSLKVRKMKVSGLSKEHFLVVVSFSVTHPLIVRTHKHTHMNIQTHIFYFIKKHSGNNQGQLINVIF